ncbi:glycosyltransferase family 76 protein [Backusella circina FSU 941]|nr:glycosyltransferase family 76 protein [Backusella circina FSU 941]
MTGTLTQIYGLAAGSRVLTTLFALISYKFTGSYDSSAEIQVGSGLLCAFLRWDALYFLHIAEHGYVYEQETAFFPVMPLMARIIAKTILAPLHSILGTQHNLLLAGVLISNLSFILAAGALYKLTLALLPTNKKLAAVSSLAFCLSPPSLFMSAFYTESLFAYLSFTGMRHVVEQNYVVAALIWGVASGVRSNAIVYSGFFFYYLLWVPLVKQAQLTTLITGLVRSILYSMVTFTGLGLFQYYCYHQFCSLDRPWCQQSIPLLYSFVQKEYWDVGFLAYYEIKQIPNFVLAAPMILLSVAGIYTYSQPHSRAFWTLQLSNSDQTSYWSGRLAVFIYLWLFMLGYVMTSMHIQVIIRFFTSLPPLYWYVAHVWLKGDIKSKSSWTATVLLSYFVLYGFIGIVLFASFLPPA